MISLVVAPWRLVQFAELHKRAAIMGHLHGCHFKDRHFLKPLESSPLEWGQSALALELAASISFEMETKRDFHNVGRAGGG